ncbi:MAG: hypothetical protein PHT59_07905 [Candidatus Omnitrophica bacterium]|nr:hypothetical protein [Candidatus Omnitrophota bacterium]
MAEQLLDEVRALASQVQVLGAGLARIDALLDSIIDELLEAV